MEDKWAVSAELRGDWTITGVVQQINPLTELSGGLDYGKSFGPSVITVDCSGIEGIDASGFQLLNTWLHCLQIRGFQPHLVGLPDEMRKDRKLREITRSVRSWAKVAYY